MIILRAAQSDVGLLLWGEAPFDAAAWLPSNGKAPLPSSHLLGDTEALTSPTTLAPWLVPALLLEREALLATLSVCWQKRILASGVVVGAALAYWAEMFRFAEALVAKQQFLPGIRTVGGELHAVWEPASDAGQQRMSPRSTRTSCAGSAPSL